MTVGIVALLLIAPLVIVPLGYRLLDVATPGSRPPAIALRAVFPTAGLLVISFLLPAGPIAAVLALPWLAFTGLTALAAATRLLRDQDRFRPTVRHATDAAVAFLAVGATFAVIDRLGVRPFDFSATVILLTAVHFHFAGFVLPLAGALAYERRPRRWLAIALGAVVVGIPVTALGFLGLPFANWIGAMLTAVGGFGIGLATLVVARAMLHGPAVGPGAGLAAVAGASLLISMPMAVIYATGILVGSSWLDMDTMAGVHGTLNALGFALPVMLAWTLDRRARNPAPPDRRPTRDPRRLGLGAAGIIAGYAIVVAAISAGATADELGPPQAVPRPVLLAALLTLPALVAAIGAIRRSRPILIAAGALCLAQSFIAFSGVTIPFVVPALLLIVIGVQRSDFDPPRRVVVGGVLVVLLGIAMWVAPFALTEPTCWVARTAADGTVVYAPMPIPESASFGPDGGHVEIHLEPGDLASGCGGSELTIQGAGLAAIFGIGAVAIAALASMTPPAGKAPREEFA